MRTGALTGDDLFNLVHPKTATSSTARLNTVLRILEQPNRFEFRVLHRNQALAVLEAIGKRFEQESTVAGYVLNSRDITESKGSEEAVRQANETLRAVIEISPLRHLHARPGRRCPHLELQRAKNVRLHAARKRLGSPLPVIFPEEVSAFRRRLTR